METIENSILVVDDNPVNVEILEEIFEGLYPLEKAESGKEALEMIVQHQPTIVLLDVMMPGMNGYETCRKIRELPEGKNLKIIMVSAKTLSSEMKEGYDAGADDFLTKPFDIELLMEKCQRYMSQLK